MHRMGVALPKPPRRPQAAWQDSLWAGASLLTAGLEGTAPCRARDLSGQALLTLNGRQVHKGVLVLHVF